MSSTHRSLTVRLSIPAYMEVATLAEADGMNLNSKFNQLVQLGLGHHISLDAALRRLIQGSVTNEPA